MSLDVKYLSVIAGPPYPARYRTRTSNRHREQSVAIHDFRLHGLLHCVRNDGIVQGRQAMQNMTQRIKSIFLAGLASLALTAQAQTVRPEVVASNLAHPWALAFLPEGRFLVTERPGRLRVIEADGRLNPALAGLPEVAAGGQGGLLDVLLDADFARNRTLFFCFSEPGAGGNSTALARARLSDDRTRLESVQGDLQRPAQAGQQRALWLPHCREPNRRPARRPAVHDPG